MKNIFHGFAFLLATVIFALPATAQTVAARHQHASEVLTAMAAAECSSEENPLAIAPLIAAIIGAAIGATAMAVWGYDGHQQRDEAERNNQRRHEERMAEMRRIEAARIAREEAQREREERQERDEQEQQNEDNSDDDESFTFSGDEEELEAPDGNPSPCQQINTFVKFCDSQNWAAPSCKTTSNLINGCVSEDNMRPVSGAICKEAQDEALDQLAKQNCETQKGIMICERGACSCSVDAAPIEVAMELNRNQIRDVCTNPAARTLFEQCFGEPEQSGGTAPGLGQPGLVRPGLVRPGLVQPRINVREAVPAENR